MIGSIKMRIVLFGLHSMQSWDGGNMNIALTSAPFAPDLKQQFPQIEDAVRIDAGRRRSDRPWE